MPDITDTGLSIADDRACNALSVDVEDYFHVSAFESYINRADWSNIESRVVANVDRILNLCDTAGAKATFFFLGCVAEQFPSLLRRVAEQGHEIASHGYSHIRVSAQNEEAFRQDVDRTKKLLEDLVGQAVTGYRAASFSIAADNSWAYDVLAETGHRYSSSIFPIRHDRYGMRDADRFPTQNNSSGIMELPVSTVEVSGLRLPCGGGGYFRLLPYTWTRWGIRRVQRNDGQPVMFYFHPWELDHEQPRIGGLDPLSKFRHYVNLKKFERKLARLLDDFRWTTIMRAYGDVL